MKQVEYTVKDALGIHARPAGMLVKLANQFACAVTIKKGEKPADAKKVFALMALATKCGDTICIECEGADEDAAAKALLNFLQEVL